MFPEPDSDRTGAISIAFIVLRANWNAMKPGIQGVLTPWIPGSSACGAAAPRTRATLLPPVRRQDRALPRLA